MPAPCPKATRVSADSPCDYRLRFEADQASEVIAITGSADAGNPSRGPDEAPTQIEPPTQTPQTPSSPLSKPLQKMPSAGVTTSDTGTAISGCTGSLLVTHSSAE